MGGQEATLGFRKDVMKTVFALLLIFLNPLYAQLDQHQRKGLDDTKTLLKDQRQRDEFIKTDKKAQEVDAKVDALAGSSKNKEEIYGISADVMEKLTVETNGDPEKMQKILNEAMKNPQAFYNKYFDEKSKARVRGVANDIQKNGNPGVPGK